MSTISSQDWLSALQHLPPARQAVLVTIAASRGSTPRGKGTRMLVTATTQYGTIGGGHLEWKALAIARVWLKEAPGQSRSPRHERLALGPSLGQCCGGALELQFDRLDQWNDAEFARHLNDYRQQQAAVPQLYLFGAGHVGAALVKVLSATPCQIHWVDERDHLFPGDAGVNVLCEATDTPEAVIAQAPAGSYFLVMTHHHGLDLRLSEHILQRHDAAWFGLIGSQTKRASFEHRLRERGCSSADLQEMVCPIGLTGITGKEPGVIAVAVAAQLLQLWSDHLPAKLSSAATSTTAISQECP
ncbi:xanthine dehydrogenase accessory protein XdhC [Undibacterium sp. Jales W-56]|uniref:xanthine dehydrogenase accessory protein XdhC n=1 Tax=Undibacterium sp. Jales W-56 TaxID=2897325 RepID=UPI0021D37A18|nr:xanthine dehydrogenase accessory protein XdhC [Undibacterium sp. Jales W-56]MCU6434184.1 xanthine dehydrogenase accessory protein XdhC [Undibacterium sp. Jales W-56]